MCPMQSLVSETPDAMLSRPQSKKPLSGSLPPSTGAWSNSTSFSQVNNPQDLERSALDNSRHFRHARYFHQGLRYVFAGVIACPLGQCVARF